MPEIRSRRDFLTGVLACGTLTAAATYLLPGGRSLPHVELNLVTGADSTGARELLASMWNHANPHTTLRISSIDVETAEQKRQMITRARSGDADIINLDLIHLPEFAGLDVLSPIEVPDDSLFLENILSAGHRAGGNSRYWAVPFNTDVGVLFERIQTPPATEVNGLTGVLNALPDGSRGFIGQLGPASSDSYEAFVVNVLEHALAVDPGILGQDGMPVDKLERWAPALAPLRSAIQAKRIHMADNEKVSREQFTANRDRRFMRNWPVYYRVLQQENDPDVQAGKIIVSALPTGILGGQSLALVTASRYQARAAEVIRFLTGIEAQKILAAHGLAPTRHAAFADSNLMAFIPHLSDLKGAVEGARPRPAHPNYGAFSAAVVKHVLPLLRDGAELSPGFVDEIQKALK